MPQYIVHKDGVFNIYSTVSDGFFYEGGLTHEQLVEEIFINQGQGSLNTLPARIARAIETGSSSRLDDTFEDLAECNCDGLSVQECIDKYMTLKIEEEL